MSPEPRLAMPQPRLTAPRVLPALLAALAAAAPLGAQHSVAGVDVNAASETATERAPQLFGSAGVAPRHRLGLSIQGTASRVESRVFVDDLRSETALATASGYRTTASMFFGLTSRVTLGGLVSGTRGVRYSLDPAPAAPPPPDGTPTRQGTRTPLGDQEMAVFARIGVWSSATGATRIAAMAGADDAVDRPVGTSAGIALQHRVGRATLHLAPSVRMSEGSPGDGDAVVGTAAWRVGAAAAFAVTPRLGLSTEVLRAGNANAISEAALGVRWRLGRIAVDAGVRSLLHENAGLHDAKRYGATLATHLVF